MAQPILTSTNVNSGYGTVLSFSTAGSTGTFTPIAGIQNLAVPTKSVSMIDVTYYGSTEDYDQTLPGGIFKHEDMTMTGCMITCSSFFSGTGTFEMWDMKTWLEDGQRIGWKIEIGTTASTMNVYYGNGYITAFALKTPLDGVATFDATLSITGKPSFGDST